MIGRRAVLGLSLLSALMFCAFGAQSASAAKSVNTTAYTCVDTGVITPTGDFKDAHCDEKGPNPGKERYAHVVIAKDVTTEVEANNLKVTNETKDHEPAVLKGNIGLTKTEISCTEVTGTPGSNLHNVETEGKHTVTGVAVVHYAKCEVKNPLKCTVKEPIVTEANVVGAEKLGAAENEMGLEFVGKGEKETFAEITYEGAECGLKNQTFKVKGSAIGTCGPTTKSGQTNKWCGATLVYTPENSMQKLRIGAETNIAEFTNIVTLTMKETGGNPISATTVT